VIKEAAGSILPVIAPCDGGRAGLVDPQGQGQFQAKKLKN
jgi:hypothetical protein